MESASAERPSRAASTPVADHGREILAGAGEPGLVPVERLLDHAFLSAECFPDGRGALVDDGGKLLAGGDEPDLVTGEGSIDRVARQSCPARPRSLSSTMAARSPRRAR